MKDLYRTAGELRLPSNDYEEKFELERETWIKETYTPTCD